MIIIYGGQYHGKIYDELWMYNISSNRWNLIQNLNTKSCSPASLIGHSSVIVNDMMYSFFGYSPDYQITNLVQRFDIGIKMLISYCFLRHSLVISLLIGCFLLTCSESLEWDCITTYGSAVRGLYGHTSVYDSTTRKIYIHGGYLDRILPNDSGRLADVLYAFDPSNRYWLAFIKYFVTSLKIVLILSTTRCIGLR